MKFRKIIFLLTVSIVACKQEQKLSGQKIVNTLSKKSSNYTNLYNKQNQLSGIKGKFLGKDFSTYIVYSEDNQVKEIKTNIGNLPFGHWFQFYKNGNLKEYSFLLFKKESSYVVTFNEDGTVDRHLGSPLVFHYNDFDNKKSVALFSTSFFDSLLVSYSFDKLKYKRFPYIEFKNYPLLYECVLPLRQQTIYFNIEAFINENRVVYQDSVKVEYK